MMKKISIVLFIVTIAFSATGCNKRAARNKARKAIAAITQEQIEGFGILMGVPPAVIQGVKLIKGTFF